MTSPITPDQLRERMRADAPYALIDVRDIGEYNASHIPGASLIPRSRLEFDLPSAVPHFATPLILCDDDCRRVARAAETAETIGYQNVAWLQGGVNRWASLDLPTEWGVNVPSKDFGERVEVTHRVPEISADQLRARIERGDDLVILDTRTPEEYQRFCIPGGRSLPGGELALRITDALADAPPDAAVVINCAGRTRSIIGTRVLQRMGLEREIVGLKNGTSGWLLAGYDLEQGAERSAMAEVSEQGRATAERYARRCAAEDGVELIDVNQLDALRARAETESVYFIDVRSAEEYAAGRIPGFRWFPADRPSNAATTSPSSTARRLSSPATVSPAPRSPHPGTGRWATAKSTRSAAALSPGPPPAANSLKPPIPSRHCSSRRATRYRRSPQPRSTISRTPPSSTSVTARSLRRGIRPARAGLRAAGSNGAPKSSRRIGAERS